LGLVVVIVSRLSGKIKKLSRQPASFSLVSLKITNITLLAVLMKNGVCGKKEVVAINFRLIGIGEDDRTNDSLIILQKEGKNE